MRKLPIEIAFSDARGAIADLLVEPLDSATRIYTAEGAIRGNHYHRDTHQWTYVIDGMLQIVTRDAGKLEEGTLIAGELLYTPPYEQHAWKALRDTTVLVLTRGPRSGVNYEQDTYRLEGSQKLI